jgi:hypothetical protein
MVQGETYGVGSPYRGKSSTTAERARNMALIDCPDCGREVSSNATICPECAYPIQTGTPAIPARAVHEPPKQSWIGGAAPIAVRLALSFIFWVIGLEEGEVSAFAASVIIGGSAIPVWYKNKIDKIKAGQSGGALGQEMAEQMAELEHRNQRRFDKIEEFHSAQIADLEERIDFTERLLTKNREVGPAE